MGSPHAAAVSAAQDAKLEPELLELIRIRASQINGCAFCIDMHTKDARAAGETEQRVYALNAWRETPFFTARERAAPALTEAVTLVRAAGRRRAGAARRSGPPGPTPSHTARPRRPRP
jgi:AhpD family alkylhydroperoxidase